MTRHETHFSAVPTRPTVLCALRALKMKPQQLKYSQRHTKRNGETLYNDWKNNFSQPMCTRLYT